MGRVQASTTSAATTARTHATMEIGTLAGRRATIRPMGARTMSASESPAAVIATRADDSRMTYQRRVRKNDGYRCRSNQS